jgi:hypothetical protein
MGHLIGTSSRASESALCGRICEATKIVPSTNLLGLIRAFSRSC